MIQDIAPHRLDNSFKNIKAGGNSVVFTFAGGNLLVCDGEDGGIALPTMEQIAANLSAGLDVENAIYAFSIDDEPMFLLPQRELKGKIPKNMEYINMRNLSGKTDRWVPLAAVTAGHLDHWYREHRYCGCCGAVSGFSVRERAKVCPECGNVQYPRISPVIMAAVTDGDRLLVTRYAGRPYKGLALIAGFVEIGESIEEALKREVMEEVGLHVENLRYFGSQPWGFSDSLISGFFADLDGDGTIQLDKDELAEAVWLSRDELPPQAVDISITAAMIEAFRKGEM